jgi:hypothetical protein
MLSSVDDYLIHQMHEVIRYVATSDQCFHDRHFWAGQANNGDLMFLGGMGVYRPPYWFPFVTRPLRAVPRRRVI